MMSEPLAGDERIATLLERLNTGDADAINDLVPLVYDQLVRLAHSQRRKHSRPSETLNTTALVNEAYLRLARSGAKIANREHLFAVAATAMRQLLVDQARRKSASKRGGDVDVVALTGLPALQVAQDDWDAEAVLHLDRALDDLNRTDARLRQVVECRVFAGLTLEETARALGTSERTARRDWAKARAWLRLALRE